MVCDSFAKQLLGASFRESKWTGKKYEWLQASKSYKKASEILLKEKDFVNVTELAECLGHCYFKAADQAETNKEFRKHMKQAVQAYRNALKILEGTIVENKRIKIIHFQALIAYVEAVVERRLLEKRNYWMNGGFLRTK